MDVREEIPQLGTGAPGAHSQADGRTPALSAARPRLTDRVGRAICFHPAFPPCSPHCSFGRPAVQEAFMKSGAAAVGVDTTALFVVHRSVAQSCARLFATPGMAAGQASLSSTISEFAQTHVHRV